MKATGTNIMETQQGDFHIMDGKKHGVSGIEETRYERVGDEDMDFEEKGDMSAIRTNLATQEVLVSLNDGVACSELDVTIPSTDQMLLGTGEDFRDARPKRPISGLPLKSSATGTLSKAYKSHNRLSVDMDLHRVRKNRSSVSINIPPTASDCDDEWLMPLSHSFNGSSCHLELSLFCENMSIDVRSQQASLVQFVSSVSITTHSG